MSCMLQESESPLLLAAKNGRRCAVYILLINHANVDGKNRVKGL